MLTWKKINVIIYSSSKITNIQISIIYELLQRVWVGESTQCRWYEKMVWMVKKVSFKTQAFFVGVTLQTHIILDNSRRIHCSEMSS